MSNPFAKHLQADGSTRWWQADPGRFVDPRQYQLVDWLAAGGVPDEVAYVAPVLPTLAEIQASKTAEIVSDCDRRLEQRWPVADRLAVTLAVPLLSGPAIAADVAAHLKARDAALDELAKAADVKQAEAVAAPWPADIVTKERAKLDTVAWDTANPAEAKP
jgi:hypothetical protein